MFRTLLRRSNRLVSSSALLPASRAVAPRVINRSAIKPSTTIQVFSAPLAKSIHSSSKLLEPALEDDVEQDDEAVATKFGELKNVHPMLLDTLVNKMKLTDMTEVQSLTLNEALQGKDVLAQAKTGTGKTIAFLLPVIHNILQQTPELAQRSRHRAHVNDTSAIVISPTRELAEQIAVQARQLCANTGIKIHTAVGGTQKRLHISNMHREGCHLIVGTPGRLHDILTDPESGIETPKLKTLILDEADRLMDDGFLPEIQRINESLPDPDETDRQTMMFSATMPRSVIGIAEELLKPDYHEIQTVRDDETPTHERVPQKIVTVGGIENLNAVLLELMQREIATAESTPGSKPFKAIVYYNTTAETLLAGEVFGSITHDSQIRSRAGLDAAPKRHLPGCRIYSIHSKLSQAQRTSASDGFRKAQSAVLLSSDVTARGMDFPNVTHVIQLGLPPRRDSYIHRIGRTGRAGAAGEGWLVIPKDATSAARRMLGDLPLQFDKSLETSLADFGGVATEMDGPNNSTPKTDEIFALIRTASKQAGVSRLSEVYKSRLGSVTWTRDKQELIDLLNRSAKFEWGLDKPPALSPVLVNKLGLSRLRGINTDVREFRGDGERTFDRGFGGDRRGDRSSSFGSREGRSAFGGSRDGRSDFGGSRDRRSAFGGFRDGRSAFGGSRGRPSGNRNSRSGSSGYSYQQDGGSSRESTRW